MKSIPLIELTLIRYTMDRAQKKEECGKHRITFYIPSNKYCERFFFVKDFENDLCEMYPDMLRDPYV